MAQTTTLMDVFNGAGGPSTVFSAPATTQPAGLSLSNWTTFLNPHWLKPGWDIIIAVVCVGGAVIYGYTVGRDRIVAMLISTYVALAVATNVPYLNQLGRLITSTSSSDTRGFIFLALFIILFVGLSRSRFLRGISELTGRWWQVFLFSLLQLGLLTSIILSFLPAAILKQLTPTTNLIFVSDLGRSAWIIVPFIALVFFRGRPRRRRGILGRIDDLDM